MTRYLSVCPVVTQIDLLKGLFLSNLVLQFLSTSKRYSPEVMTFILGTFHSFFSNSQLKSKHTTPEPDQKQLINIPTATVQLPIYLDTKKSFKNIIPPINFQLLKNDDLKNNEEMSIIILGSLYNLLEFSIALYAELPSFPEIVDPIKWIFEKETITIFGKNETLKQKHNSLKELLMKKIENKKLTRDKLVLHPKKPKSIPQYNPEFIEGYSVDKNYDINIERAEMKKLKKET